MYIRMAFLSHNLPLNLCPGTLFALPPHFLYNQRMLIDLTQLITNGMPVYPGDEPPQLTETVHFDEHQCVNHQIKSSMHVGTHMDGPMHMVRDGRKLCDLPVDRFVGRGILVDARGRAVIDADVLEGVTVEAGDIVLFWTDWSKKWGSEEYYGNFPVLTPALAEKLVTAGVKMIGLDTPSPDGEPYTVHRILLGKEILIVENLVGLEALAGKAFEVFALPTKYDADSAPVRVVARVS